MKIESIAAKLHKLIIEKSEGNSGPFMVGLSGGQGSGKTTLSEKLEELLILEKVSCCVSRNVYLVLKKHLGYIWDLCGIYLGFSRAAFALF